MPPPQTRSRLTFAATAWSSRSREPLAGDPGGEAVVGDPVDAPDEDRAVVDEQRERGALVVRGGVEAHRAEADPPRQVVRPAPSSPARCLAEASAAAPYPRGHQSHGVGGDRAVTRRAACQPRSGLATTLAGDRRGRRPSPRVARSRGTCTVATAPTLAVDGHLRADLGQPRHRPALSPTGRQMPAVTRSGPKVDGRHRVDPREHQVDPLVGAGVRPRRTRVE